MIEYVDVVDDLGEVVGRIERAEAHARGIRHRAVQVILATSGAYVPPGWSVRAQLVTGDWYIPLQRRRTDKPQYPRWWGGSAAGHVEAGEDPDDAADRETFEETGTRPALERIGTYVIHDGIENEQVFAYLGRTDGPFSFDTCECERAKFFRASYLGRRPPLRLTPHCATALDLALARLI